MASGVKGTGLLQLALNPPGKTSHVDVSGESDFKVELQRFQTPPRPSDAKSSNPDSSSKPTHSPGTTSETSHKKPDAASRSRGTDTEGDTDVPTEANGPTKKPPAADSADKSDVDVKQKGAQTPDVPTQKTEDKPDPTIAQEALAQATPTAVSTPAPVAPKTSASDSTTVSQDDSATGTKQEGQKVITQPLTAAPAAAKGDHPAAAPATPAVKDQPPAVATAAVAATAATAAPPAQAPAAPPAQSTQPAVAKAGDGLGASVSPQEAAIQAEAGVKVVKVGGKQSNGQADAGTDRGSPQGDESEFNLAVPSVVDADTSHKIKLADGTDSQSTFNSLLSTPEAKPASAPPTATLAPIPTSRPDVQFAEANHPSIVSSIRGQLLPNGGSMQIRLDPPELGAMQVSVQMRNGVMTASFETSSDEATRMLSHSLNQLKTALESQGVQVDKLQVRQQTSRESHNQESGARQQQQQAQDNPARQQQQRRDLMRRMWAKLALGDEPLDITG